MIAINPPLRFGRFKGTPVSEVPTQYLTWVMETFDRPPDYVVAEVVRRGSTQFGGDAILCQAAVSDRTFKDARSAKKRWQRKTRGPKGRRAREVKAQRVAVRPDHQREKAAAKMEEMKGGIWVVGEYSARLRSEFIAKGGDFSECPF